MKTMSSFVLAVLMFLSGVTFVWVTDFVDERKILPWLQCMQHDLSLYLDMAKFIALVTIGPGLFVVVPEVAQQLYSSVKDTWSYTIKETVPLRVSALCITIGLVLIGSFLSTRLVISLIVCS